MLETHDLQNLQTDFEMGKLLFASGSFSKSLPYFERSLKQFQESGDLDSYIRCYSRLTNVLFDLQEWEKLNLYKEELDRISQQSDFLENPLVPALQAHYSLYLEKDFEGTKKKLNQALKLAIANNEQCFERGDILGQQQSRFEVIVCLSIYSYYYYEIKDYKRCLKELENLDVLIKDYIKLKTKMEQEPSDYNSLHQDLKEKLVSNLNRNFFTVQNMNWSVQIAQTTVQIHYFKNYKQAEKRLWNLYREVNQNHFKYFVPYIFSYMAFCYIKLNNKNKALTFLNLAEKDIEPGRKQLFGFLEKLKKAEKIGSFEDSTESKYDIVFDMKQHIIIEKDKGYFELKNKFVLMDLLKLFLSHPGVSYSKEQIVKKIWNQDYSPDLHDNKLYVTIKRLREIVEVNSCKPCYICRNSAGYYFSTSAKVLIK